jgi:Family of unknown function (DUF6508)
MKPKKKRRPIRSRIEAVIRFLPIFEAIGPNDFARIIHSSDATEEEPTIGHLKYHPAVYEFMQACYENGLVLSFDWGAWAVEARRYMGDPVLVASASLVTCVKLLTAHLRAERFCDGHLQEVLRSGHISAILQRLQQLPR